MTRAQVRSLRPGDEVTWTDPDDGLCSKTVRIVEIDWRGEVVRIMADDGSELEAFARELS